MQVLHRLVAHRTGGPQAPDPLVVGGDGVGSQQAVAAGGGHRMSVIHPPKGTAAAADSRWVTNVEVGGAGSDEDRSTGHAL